MKIDSDGQMDPRLIGNFVQPILDGKADYTKGQSVFRYRVSAIDAQAAVARQRRVILPDEFSSGYWNIMDPTNGFTAINTNVLTLLPLDKLDQRYFFESDMLFRLNTVWALVVDIPMTAKYNGEDSHLVPEKVALGFFAKHIKRTGKRIFYNYFLRDFSIGTLYLVAGAVLTLFGLAFRLYHWSFIERVRLTGNERIVMLAAIPALVGVQSLISALSYDIANAPRHTVHDPVSDARDRD